VGTVIAFVVAPWRAVGRSSIALVSAVGLIAAAFAVARDASLLDAGCAALTVGCLATVACLARRLGAANELAGRLVRDLEASRERERESAADGMRHSIARDLHDILAHSLSALVLHLDAARTIAADSVDSDLQTALDRAHHLARAGLDEARQAIGVLRDDRSLPGPDELPALVEQFGLATGTPCTLRQRGQPRALGHEIQLNVYRVAQEALTNIARHADATAAAVMLEYAPDCVRLVVQDDGRTAAACQDPLTAGYGLSGMAERAELLDGCLTAGPTSAGFRVELVVPT
jgi:signal transduction histidine kinase